MRSIALSNQEAANGFTHKFEVTHADLTTVNAVHTQALITLQEGQFIVGTASKLITDFAGGAATGLTMQIGNADIDEYAAAIELLGTEIDYHWSRLATSAVADTNQNVGDTEAVTATFTCTGDTCNDLTAGEVHILLQVLDVAARA